MRDRGIAPGLLVASPDLRDPHFARSVVLMIQHDEESSFGLVVNRRAEPSLAAEGPAPAEWPFGHAGELFRGGPIDPGPGEPLGFVLHYPSAARDGGEGEADGLVLYTVPLDEESLALLENEESERVRFVLGYSRWGAGQLELELLQGAWLVAEADPRIIFQTPIDGIWEAAVRSLGIAPETLLPGSLVAGPEIH